MTTYASSSAKTFEIHYLPTKASRKVRVAGIWADNEYQARKFLRQQYGLRLGQCKVLSCVAIA